MSINPILLICREQGLSTRQLALHADVQTDTVRRFIRGETKTLGGKVLDALQDLGYDRSELVQTYEKWRKEIAFSVKGA